MATISRNEYVNLFGPTVGDRIRLGDTGLFVEIERDLRGRFGDEIVFGGGKSLREGMGMDNRLTRKAGALSSPSQKHKALWLFRVGNVSKPSAFTQKRSARGSRHLTLRKRNEPFPPLPSPTRTDHF